MKQQIDKAVGQLQFNRQDCEFSEPVPSSTRAIHEGPIQHLARIHSQIEISRHETKWRSTIVRPWEIQPATTLTIEDHVESNIVNEDSVTIDVERMSNCDDNDHSSTF
jgi:hypothetical protein